MKLNLKSWHARLVKADTGKVPMSLCSYFWLLVVILIMLPVTWVGYLFKEVREQHSTMLNLALTVVIYILMFFGYNLGVYALLMDDSTTLGLIFTTLSGTVFLATILAVILGIFLGLFEIYETISDKIYFARNNLDAKQGKKYILIERYRAFRKKYCPKIDWYNG